MDASYVIKTAGMFDSRSIDGSQQISFAMGKSMFEDTLKSRQAKLYDPESQPSYDLQALLVETKL